jgi:hypothetical protein
MEISPQSQGRFLSRMAPASGTPLFRRPWLPRYNGPMPRRIRRSAALLLLACAALAGEVRTLTILHLNDLHAHISPEHGRGGFAYLATVIQRERANCPDCILLNAGDLVQGSPVSTIFHGDSDYTAANQGTSENLRSTGLQFPTNAGPCAISCWIGSVRRRSLKAWNNICQY